MTGTGHPEVVEIGIEGAAMLSTLHATCFDPPWSTETFAELLGASGGRAWVGLGGDSLPAAFLIAQRTLDEAEILTFGVAPAERRRGLARAMLDCAIVALSDSGARAIFLEVALGNGTARRLYHRAGFRAVGQRTGYYRHPDGTTETALVLRRDR